MTIKRLFSFNLWKITNKKKPNLDIFIVSRIKTHKERQQCFNFSSYRAKRSQKLSEAIQHEATRINLSAFIKFCTITTGLLLVFVRGWISLFWRPMHKGDLSFLWQLTYDLKPHLYLTPAYSRNKEQLNSSSIEIYTVISYCQN